MRSIDKSRVKIWHKFAVIITLVVLIYLSITSWIAIKVISHYDVTVSNKFPLIVVIMLALTIAAVVTVIISGMFLEPIDQMSDAMKKVASGDFSVHIDNNHRHCRIKNIEIMNTNFNKMVDGLNSTEMLKTDFITNVSHELKTPLASIEGYASLLSATELSDEQRLYTSNIMRSASKLTTLTGNILRLSKLDNQQMALKESEFSLDEQIRQAILLQEKSWSDKELDIEPDLDPISFIGYEELLEHVWSNLISNAIKFTPKNGTIAFSLHEQDGNIVAIVRDTGIGMSDFEQEHVFDKFYQAETNHSAEGNGLGLPLVKKIVSMHNGTIRIESRPNEGAAFIVTLPKSGV